MCQCGNNVNINLGGGCGNGMGMGGGMRGAAMETAFGASLAQNGNPIGGLLEADGISKLSGNGGLFNGNGGGCGNGMCGLGGGFGGGGFGGGFGFGGGNTVINENIRIRT